MTNKHIKIINGRKYYYSSIRKGKKVTSKYIGPVERIRKSRKKTLEEQLAQDQMMDGMADQEPFKETGEEDNYIG